MKLSELIAQREEAVRKDAKAVLPTMAFGIEVDEGYMEFDPPPGISEIGLIGRFKDDGDFADEILDLAISYQMSPVPVSVLIEIPAEAEFKDANHIVSTIEAVNAGVSFLPPEVLDDASFERYCQRIEAVTEAWCGKVNFSNVLLPVSSYFQHMVVELLNPGFAASFVPEDEYILERFHNPVPVERSDALKARIRAVVKNAFTDEDGVERFEEVMIALCAKAIDHVEDETKEMAKFQVIEPEDPNDPAVGFEVIEPEAATAETDVRETVVEVVPETPVKTVRKARKPSKSGASSKGKASQKAASTVKKPSVKKPVRKRKAKSAKPKKAAKTTTARE
ncbi:hypothetical protein OIU34_24485 [Pararhizobium sp. BT-229]|uniref:hypothetical protein n=1 Tax=Pararhizobium sp. BT-229 TaxID=2986923 RepID=UPI0021F745F9|nr:hypothetical protein [Pararhizobium sp. BT-229]MCV9965059.1 hypothetical protein [Pararhizobium sp. BT-229]